MTSINNLTNRVIKLLNSINTLNKNYKYEIYNLFKFYHIDYTANNNGIFINMTPFIYNTNDVIISENDDDECNYIKTHNLTKKQLAERPELKKANDIINSIKSVKSPKSKNILKNTNTHQDITYYDVLVKLEKYIEYINKNDELLEKINEDYNKQLIIEKINKNNTFFNIIELDEEWNIRNHPKIKSQLASITKYHNHHRELYEPVITCAYSKSVKKYMNMIKNNTQIQMPNILECEKTQSFNN